MLVALVSLSNFVLFGSFLGALDQKLRVRNKYMENASISVSKIRK